MNPPLSVVGIMVNNRSEIAPELQEVITRRGSEIICRMGVPSPSKENGLITLIYKGDLERVDKFRQELENLPGIAVKIISFNQEP